MIQKQLQQRIKIRTGQDIYDIKQILPDIINTEIFDYI